MKKLFSYLLISSMVVLSSCTNYDDQFDDLNTQINTLKSQIEGFSSLSSGLTALQGTVASLQTAINNIPVTPATDISGLEASLAALSTTVKALQTSLASAATAAEVAALQTALTKAQTDLTELLASNNVFTPSGVFKITTPAELTFAESLAGKVGIINGDITVTQSSAMDAAKLAAVLAKIITVTGDVIYTATGTSITPTAGFTKLASVTDLTVDADGDISFPALASAGQVLLTTNAKTTNVSFPVLASVTTLGGATFGDHILSFTGATGFDMGALARYSATTLSITTKDGLTNLDALQILAEDGTTKQITDLTINGATELSIDALTRGEISANKITSVDFPIWEGDNASRFAKATTVVLPKITANDASATYDVTAMFPNATSVHIIGASKALTPLTTGFISVSAIAHADLETVIFDGVLETVTITGSTSVDDITLTGTAKTVNIQNTAVTAMNLGYSSGKTGTTNALAYNGTLTITDNEDMTSFTADKVDDVYSLTITSNSELATVSMSALNSLGTTAASTASHVNVHGNKLVASNFQLPSGKNDVPVVAGKITTASGLDGLKAYIDLAIATTGSISKVQYDEVEKYTTSTGVVHEVNGANPGAPADVNYSGTKTLYPGTPGALFVVVDISPDSRSYDVVLARKQTNTQYLVTGSTFSGVTPEFTFDGAAATDGPVSLVANTTFTNAITDFVSTDPDTWFPEVVSALQTKIDAAGYGYTLSANNDYGATGVYSVQVLSTSGLADESNGLSYNGVVWVTLDRTQVSATLATANALSNLHTAIAAAINNGALSSTYTATAGSTSVTLEKQIAANNGNPDLDFTAYPAMTFGGYTTNTNTSAVGMSYTLAVNQTLSKKWRVTAENNNMAENALNLEAGVTFLTATNNSDDSAINLTMTAVPAAGRYGTTTASTLQIPFSAVTAGSSTDDGTGAAASTVDYTSYL